MARGSGRSPTLGIGRTVLIFAGGLGVILVGTLLAVGADTKRIETFGLARLVDGRSGESDHVATPIEEARRQFNERARATPEARNPEIAGTKLMLRAIGEFNARERDIMVRDAVRYLRRNREAKAEVYALVDAYLAKNPQLAESGREVKVAVDRALAADGQR